MARPTRTSAPSDTPRRPTFEGAAKRAASKKATVNKAARSSTGVKGTAARKPNVRAAKAVTADATVGASESIVEKAIVKYLKALKDACAFFKMGLYGWPDRVLCYRGVFIGIEIKPNNPDRHATKLQARRLRTIRNAGGFGIVARSVEDVQTVIDMIDDAIAPRKQRSRPAGRRQSLWAPAKVLEGQIPLPWLADLQAERRGG